MNNILIISIILLSLIGVYINSRLDFNKVSQQHEDNDEVIQNIIPYLNNKSSVESGYLDNSKSRPSEVIKLISSRDRNKGPINRVPNYTFHGPGKSVLDALDILGSKSVGKPAKNNTRPIRSDGLNNKTGVILSTKHLDTRDKSNYYSAQRSRRKDVSLHERQVNKINSLYHS